MTEQVGNGGKLKAKRNGRSAHCAGETESTTVSTVTEQAESN